jgi:hypothetical protein
MLAMDPASPPSQAVWSPGPGGGGASASGAAGGGGPGRPRPVVAFTPEPLSMVHLDALPEGNPTSFLPRRVSPYKVGAVAPAPPSPVVFDTEGSMSSPGTPPSG